VIGLIGPDRPGNQPWAYQPDPPPGLRSSQGGGRSEGSGLRQGGSHCVPSTRGDMGKSTPNLPRPRLACVTADNEKAKGKRGGLRSTSWKPGCPSPNPGGRSRSSFRASEAVRELVEPEEWIAFELAIARDPNQTPDRRSAAWHALIDRGFTRAPSLLEASVTTGASQPGPDLSNLSDDEFERILAMAEGRAPAVLGAGDGSEARALDDATPRSETDSDATVTSEAPLHDV
jgi:hypothetical protein